MQAREGGVTGKCQFVSQQIPFGDPIQNKEILATVPFLCCKSMVCIKTRPTQHHVPQSPSPYHISIAVSSQNLFWTFVAAVVVWAIKASLSGCFVTIRVEIDFGS